MIFDKIIIFVAILISILLYKKTKPYYLKLILIGFVLSLFFGLFENQILTTISFYSFGILSLLFTVINGVNKKWKSLIISGFAFISFVFKLMHFPFANELKLLMLIPILSYLIILRKWESQKNEIAILTVIFAYELCEFIILMESFKS